MSVVYLAEDLRLGRKVALKLAARSFAAATAGSAPSASLGRSAKPSSSSSPHSTRRR
jgi:hypothetical protein